MVQSKLGCFSSDKERSVIENQCFLRISRKKKDRVYLEILILATHFVLYILVRFIGKFDLNGACNSDLALNSNLSDLFLADDSHLQRINQTKLIIFEDDLTFKGTRMQREYFELIQESLSAIDCNLLRPSNER
jgi:hypothetical protein